MLAILGLTIALILITVLAHSSLHSAFYGITLSNGVDVLVSPEMYREIVRQYKIGDEPDELERWDQAVLDVLRPERPNEWKYLVRSLGYKVSGEIHATRRRRRAAMHRSV